MDGLPWERKSVDNSNLNKIYAQKSKIILCIKILNPVIQLMTMEQKQELYL